MVRIGIWCGHHALLTVSAGFAAYTLGLYGLGMPFSACLFFLLLFPAWEDFRTRFISDTWSLLLGLCGLATSFRAGCISASGRAWEREISFSPLRRRCG